MMERFVFVLLLGYCCIVGVDGQIGQVACTDLVDCVLLTNSFCNLGTGVCECPFSFDSLGTSCDYNCGDLTAPTNGQVTTADGTNTDDEGTYSCNSGYAIVGSTTTTCVENSDWDNTAPTCRPGEVGDDCTVTTVCDNINFAQCLASTCQCLAGYEDDGTSLHCIDINECAGHACLNGATCVDGIDEYSCTCLAGYAGEFCATDTDECADNECENGASCVDGINKYTCTCVTGYEGTHCEINLNECDPDPCQNGAACVDGVNEYTCNCVDGYDGTNCETIKEITCAENDDSRGLTWPETISGNTKDKPCAPGFTGLISRKCRSDGSWQLPQYDCVRESVHDVEEKVSTLNVNATENDVSDVIKEINKVSLQNETIQGHRLTGGELNVISSSLGKIAEILVTKTDLLNDNITKNFFESASNLFTDTNQEGFRSMSESESRPAETLLKAVDSIAEALSKSIATSEENKTVIVRTKNIAIEVKALSNEGILFPDPQEVISGEDDEDTKWLQETQSSLMVETESLKNRTEKYVTSAVIYRDLSGILSTKQKDSTKATSDSDEAGDEEDIINAPILALTISPPVSDTLDPQITLTFEHYKRKNYTGPSCVFWSFQRSGAGFWSTEGCTVKSNNDNFTVCECDHLTNFAVLMSPFIEADASSKALRIISMVGVGISIACLIATLIVHFYLWKYLRNDRTTALMNLCAALLISYIIFLAGFDRTENTAACSAIAAVLQYIYLVVFCIMLVEGIEIAIIVLYVFKRKSRIRIMLILAWVIPAVIVGISLGVSKLKGYENENFCWLSVDNGLIWSFVGPALLVITFNTICLIIVLCMMFQTKSMEQKKASEKIKTSFRSLCVLVPVMGVSWILGIFYITESFYFVQYIFAILNGLQGFFIFLFHCVLNAQIKKALLLWNRRRLSAKETLKSTLRNSSKNERQSKDLRETNKSNTESEAFAQDTSTDWKDKILQPHYSPQGMKFFTPLDIYGAGRQAAAFNAESRDQLTGDRSRPYYDH